MESNFSHNILNNPSKNLINKQPQRHLSEHQPGGRNFQRYFKHLNSASFFFPSPLIPRSQQSSEVSGCLLEEIIKVLKQIELFMPGSYKPSQTCWVFMEWVSPIPIGFLTCSLGLFSGDHCQRKYVVGQRSTAMSPVLDKFGTGFGHLFQILTFSKM